ncbi:nucleoside triphosphate pyrophosphohydrolase [Thiothrix eikelboomii]|uniref:nucleoside triphosphate pyrophosphohydrolase n=1 Tax=Thiothrix eikelboomii TaxID=92487 RepID=UPI003BAFD46B
MSIASPPSAIQTLLNLMAELRDPVRGCPWDRKQTWQSLLPYTLEETYEVVDAVDRNDPAALCDELGDLLLQVVFMAQIAKEQGLFDFEAVARGISEKLVRRHPHVFDETVYASEIEQKQAWEAIKQVERAEQAQTGLFAGIPAALPALRRAQKIQKRAAHVGFDWANWQQVVPKVHEELDEVAEAVAHQEPFARIEEEMGDVLLAASNMARMLGVDAENALRLSNRKFEQRFERVEALLADDQLSLEAASLAQMEAAWEAAKLEEKSKT